ncbi:MAG: DUF975 family protein [Gammaproteobacteria bacterium]|nr:DUF975 family protein [Gammaproteobacteria bacterium]
MTDIYKTPDSNLNNTIPAGNYGSLEKGIAGDYEFSIGATLSEAWDKTKNAKGTFNLAFFLYFMASMAIMMVGQFAMIPLMSNQADPSTIITVSLIEQVIFNLILMPIAMGLFVLALRRSVDSPIDATSIFSHYRKTFSIFGTMLLMYLMILIGYILFILPGIYLTFAYMLALPLIIDKNLSPWQALEASRKAISKRWFSIFFFMIICLLIMIISTIPLGLGLIWTMPMLIIAYAIIYRNIFGYETETIN